MIDYDPSDWRKLFCSCRGSVFPKAIMVAFTPACLAGFLQWQMRENPDVLHHIGLGESGNSIFGGFSYVLGFLVVFRSQLGYNRWWEGGTLLCQLRGEFLNSYSSLLAFCNSDPAMRADVEKFQHRLVRLYSLLYGAALTQVTPNAGEVSEISLNTFELINLDGFDPESLRFLRTCPDMLEVVLQWIQRLIIEMKEANILKIEAPILTRVFGELGHGVVHLNNARKIKDFPFPFPSAQMTVVMLVFHSCVTPIICAATVETPFWATVVTFTVVFCYWSVLFIANELEMPYGDDPNDLPLYDLSSEMNKSLIQLMKPLARQVPRFFYVPNAKAQAGTFAGKTDVELMGLESFAVDLDSDMSVTAVNYPEINMRAHSEMSRATLPAGAWQPGPTRSLGQTAMGSMAPTGPQEAPKNGTAFKSSYGTAAPSKARAVEEQAPPARMERTAVSSTAQTKAAGLQSMMKPMNYMKAAAEENTREEVHSPYTQSPSYTPTHSRSPSRGNSYYSRVLGEQNEDEARHRHSGQESSPSSPGYASIPPPHQERGKLIVTEETWSKRTVAEGSWSKPSAPSDLSTPHYPTEPPPSMPGQTSEGHASSDE